MGGAGCAVSVTCGTWGVAVGRADIWCDVGKSMTLEYILVSLCYWFVCGRCHAW